MTRYVHPTLPSAPESDYDRRLQQYIQISLGQTLVKKFEEVSQVTDLMTVVFGSGGSVESLNQAKPLKLLYEATANLGGLFGVSSASDTFTTDSTRVLHHYGLAWKNFSDLPGTPQAALSGFGGIRFYTAGVFRGRFTDTGILDLINTAGGSNDPQIRVARNTDASGAYTWIRMNNAAGARQLEMLSCAAAGVYGIPANASGINAQASMTLSVGDTARIRINGAAGSVSLVPIAADPAGTAHGDIWARSDGVFRRNRNGTIETW